MYVETNKNIFYPGETINLSVNLSLTNQIDRVDRIIVQVFGNESFKFDSTKKNFKSLSNKRQVVN